MPREPDHPFLGLTAAEGELRQLQARVQRSSWLSALRWKWLLHRHSDLFAAVGVQVAAQLLAHPLQTLRVREQARSPLQDVCGVERRKAKDAPVLRGCGYTLARDFGFRGAYLLGAAGARAAGAGDLPAFLAAGLLATLLTTPFDVCFTRLVGQRITRYASLRAALGAIFREEGLGRLAAGTALRLLAFTGPALAARWLTRPLRDELDEAFAPGSLLRGPQNKRD